MKSTSADQALEELGRRIARTRLNQNLSQAELAREAGISTPTVQRMESGSSTQLSSLLRVLRVLGLFGNLDALVPDPVVSPVQRIRMRGKVRQRASSSRPTEPDEPWTWDDES